MRGRPLLIASTLAAFAVVLAGGAAPQHDDEPQHHDEPPPEPTPARIDFGKQIRPILETRCQPCHFPGGKVYEELPFDRAETTLELGERLFTRIKAADEQQLIRQFLAQEAAKQSPGR